MGHVPLVHHKQGTIWSAGGLGCCEQLESLHHFTYNCTLNILIASKPLSLICYDPTLYIGPLLHVLCFSQNSVPPHPALSNPETVMLTALVLFLSSASSHSFWVPSLLFSLPEAPMYSSSLACQLYLICFQAISKFSLIFLAIECLFIIFHVNRSCL